MLSPGAFVAILVWAAASAGFAFYVANFASYNKTYGSVAGVIVALLWLWLTNVALLFGAEIDAEREAPGDAAEASRDGSGPAVPDPSRPPARRTARCRNRSPRRTEVADGPSPVRRSTSRPVGRAASGQSRPPTRPVGPRPPPAGPRPPPVGRAQSRPPTPPLEPRTPLVEPSRDRTRSPASAFPSPVPPGTGWPDDPPTPDTPVAASAAEVAALADATDLAELDARVSVCAACPRLVAWREEVARPEAGVLRRPALLGPADRRAGDPPTRAVLIVGLAPAANGGNRTGRIFTGDRSGDWLFASLHRVGLARQATSVHAGDGQGLIGARMVAAVRCAPPQNKPTTAERDTCAPWIARELQLVAPSVRVVVCLGGFGWTAALGALRGRRVRGAAAAAEVRPRRRGRAASMSRSTRSPLLGCYHPSQQNTFTGRLTEDMLDAVLARAKELAGRRVRAEARLGMTPAAP